MNRLTSWLLSSSTIATTVTGVGYFWTKYLARSDDPWAAINHPWQPWFLKAHILVAPILLFAIGLFMVQHVSRHYARGTRKGRRTGLAITLLVGPMVLTGYFIQVITHQGWLQAMAVSHIVLGTVYALGFGVHRVVIGREGRSEQGGPRAAAAQQGRSPRTGPPPLRTFASRSAREDARSLSLHHPQDT